MEVKFKKGDLVQVYIACAAKIKRVNKKLGYTLDTFPTKRAECAYFSDKELVKINKQDLNNY